MYKNIIFDVGNVLLSYRWCDALVMAGVNRQEALKLGETIFDEPLWAELDLGKRPYFDIVNELSQKYPENKGGIVKFLTNVENMPIDRPKVWEEVRRLKDKGYKLYILSNYSEYMFSNHTEGKPFIKMMDGIMVSYMVHINKPDVGIYNALLQKYNLCPEECLFLDDREENVEGAIKCGIDAINVSIDENMLLDELRKL